jgi:hypothetical protein
MKQLLSAAFWGLVFGSSATFGQMYPLAEGTQEIQLSGSMNFDAADGDSTRLEFGYGYFLRENIQLGPQLYFYDGDSGSAWRGDLFGESHADLGWFALPYWGGSLGYMRRGGDLDDSGIVAGLRLGFKAFLLEDLALDLSARGDWASGEVFRTDDGAEKTSLSLQLGLRFFY